MIKKKPGSARKIIGALLLAGILCGFIVRVPVLRVKSSDQEILFYARPGDKLDISSFHSLYHVTQTEHWTIEGGNNMRLDRLYFGCYEAGEYYSTYFMERYMPFSGAGDYYVDLGDIVQDNIRLIITPTSQFRIQLRGRTHLLYEQIHGFCDLSCDRVPLFDWIGYQLFL